MIENQFYSPLIQFISRDIALDGPTIDLIGHNCREVVFPKNHLILKDNNVCNAIFFLVSGKARSFYTDPTGKTTTWLFHFNNPASNINNLFIADYKSFLDE